MGSSFLIVLFMGCSGSSIRGHGQYSGLLPPQVASEFLSQTCVNAWLPPVAWLDEDTEVQHYQPQIFAEVAPGRKVFEKSFLEGAKGMCGT
jgi:uncharacterized protein